MSLVKLIVTMTLLGVSISFVTAAFVQADLPTQHTELRHFTTYISSTLTSLALPSGRSIKNFSENITSTLFTVASTYASSTASLVDSQLDRVIGFIESVFSYFSETIAKQNIVETKKKIENSSSPLQEKPAAQIDAKVEQAIETVKNDGLQLEAVTKEPNIIERTILREIAGITSGEVDRRINILNNQILQELATLKNLFATRIDSNTRMIQLTQRIDELKSVTLTNVTVSGVSGLTDADIPNGITASSYLPLSGGMLTGSLAGTDLTLSGNLSVYGTQTLSGVLTVSSFSATSTTATSTIAGGFDVANGGLLYDFSSGNVGIGTTTPAALFSVQGDAMIAGTSTMKALFATSTITVLGNDGTASSTIGGGLILSSGGLTFSNLDCTGFTGSGKLTTDSSGNVICSNDTSGTVTVNSGTQDRLAYYSSGTAIDSATLLSINNTDTAFGIATSSYAYNSNLTIVASSSASDILTLKGLTSQGGNALTVQDFASTTLYSIMTDTGTTTIAYNTNATSTVNQALNAWSIAQYTTVGDPIFSIDGLNQVVGIGTSTPDTNSILAVQGNALISGTTSVNGLIATSSVFLATDRTANVGIGTLLPQFTLDVTGTVRATQLASFDNGFISSASSTVNSSLTTQDLYASSTLAVGSNALVVTSGGNVGIGTAAPGVELDVFGQGRFKGVSQYNQTTNTSLRVSGNSNPNSSLLFGYDETIDAGYIQSALIGSSYKALLLNPNAGNVGIGTLAPQYTLDVTGTVRATQLATFDNGFVSSASSSVASTLTVSGDLYASSTLQATGNGLFYANVGIGTTSPGTKLQVIGDMRIGQNAPDANDIYFSTGGTITHSYNVSDHRYILSSNGGTDFGIPGDRGALQLGQSIIAGGGAGVTGNLGFYTAGNVTARMLIDYNGNVGIGTTSPLSLLNVHQNAITAGSSSPMFRLDTNDTGNATDLFAQFTSDFAVTNDIEFAFLTDGSAYADTAWVGGGADVAEYMTVSSVESLGPGDIVMIDTQTNSMVKKSDGTPYSPMVIGVVSTKPGLIAAGGEIEKSKDNQVLVALAGRVPVKVSLEGGEIAPGDRITSSSLPGVGMKATSSGQTIGIALEAFDGRNPKTDTSSYQSTGTILVFINLSYAHLDSKIKSGNILAEFDGEGESAFWSVDHYSGRIKFISPLDINDFDLLNVTAIRGSQSKWSIDEHGQLSVEGVRTKRLDVEESATFGTSEQPQGITIYDTISAEPYCITITGGEFLKTKGMCDTIDFQSVSKAESDQQTLGNTPDENISLEEEARKGKEVDAVSEEVEDSTKEVNKEEAVTGEQEQGTSKNDQIDEESQSLITNEDMVKENDIEAPGG